MKLNKRHGTLRSCLGHQEIRKKEILLSGNQKKRKPVYYIRTPSTFAYLPHGVELETIFQNFVSYS